MLVPNSRTFQYCIFIVSFFPYCFMCNIIQTILLQHLFTSLPLCDVFRHTRRRRKHMTKPEFHKPLTWNIGPDGHTLPFTRRQLHLVYCNPHSWATYTHIIIGRNQFRIKKRDVRKATCERFLKAIFVSPDPNSTDPDDTIQEDRYGELQQIVKVSAMGEEHIILRVLWYPDYACLVDELTKNIYILRQTASNMEESFISASSFHTQVAIVPVPFTPARLSTSITM